MENSFCLIAQLFLWIQLLTAAGKGVYLDVIEIQQNQNEFQPEFRRHLTQLENCSGAKYCIDNCPYDYVEAGCEWEVSEEEEEEEYQFVVQLQVPRRLENSLDGIAGCYTRVCSAVLVHNNIALTTASCIQPLLLSPDSLTSQFNDIVQVTRTQNCLHQNGTETSFADVAVIHPDYDSTTESNDLAIIVLEEFLSFGFGFPSLQASSSKNFQGPAQKLGYDYIDQHGKRNYTYSSTVPLVLESVVISDDLCSSLLYDQDIRTVKYFNANTQLCAIIQERSSCSEARSSPLFVKEYYGENPFIGQGRSSGRKLQQLEAARAGTFSHLFQFQHHFQVVEEYQLPTTYYYAAQVYDGSYLLPSVTFQDKSSSVSIIIKEDEEKTNEDQSIFFSKDGEDIIVVGLASWRPIGNCKQPQIFTKLATYQEWIQQQIIEYADAECLDIPPDATFPCEFQVALGNCDEPPYISLQNSAGQLVYCLQSCNLCEIGDLIAAQNAQPVVIISQLGDYQLVAGAHASKLSFEIMTEMSSAIATLSEEDMSIDSVARLVVPTTQAVSFFIATEMSTVSLRGITDNSFARGVMDASAQSIAGYVSESFSIIVAEAGFEFTELQASFLTTQLQEALTETSVSLAVTGITDMPLKVQTYADAVAEVVQNITFQTFAEIAGVDITAAQLLYTEPCLSFCNNDSPTSSITCQQYVASNECSSILGFCECSCYTCKVDSEISMIFSSSSIDQTIEMLQEVLSKGVVGISVIGTAITNGTSQGNAEAIASAISESFGSPDVPSVAMIEAIILGINEGGEEIIQVAADSFILADRKGFFESLAYVITSVLVTSHPGSLYSNAIINILNTAILKAGCEAIQDTLKGAERTADSWFNRGDAFYEAIKGQEAITLCLIDNFPDVQISDTYVVGSAIPSADIITRHLLNGEISQASIRIQSSISEGRPSDVTTGVVNALVEGAEALDIIDSIVELVDEMVLNIMSNVFDQLYSEPSIVGNFIFESWLNGSMAAEITSDVLSQVISMYGCTSVQDALKYAKFYASNINASTSFLSFIPQIAKSCIDCEDVYLEGTNDCNVVILNQLCDLPSIKGIYCSKTCGNCQGLQEERYNMQFEAVKTKNNTCNWKAYDFSDSICKGINTQIHFGESQVPPMYMISLQVPVVNKDNFGECFEHFCGAALIAPNIVLTAAHCLQKLYFGRIKQSGIIEKRVYAARAPDCRHDQGYERIIVYKAFIYTEYDEQMVQGDVAILELSGSWEGPYLQYQQAWNKVLPEQLDLVIMGYGQQTMEDKGYNNYPFMALQMYYLPDEICMLIMRSNSLTELLNVFSNDIMLCAEAYDGATCDGDSGGPIVIKNYSNEADDILVGINSFGRNVPCGQGKLTIFAEVGKNNITSWIDFMVQEYASAKGSGWQKPLPLQG